MLQQPGVLCCQGRSAAEEVCNRLILCAQTILTQGKWYFAGVRFQNIFCWHLNKKKNTHHNIILIFAKELRQWSVESDTHRNIYLRFIEVRQCWTCAEKVENSWSAQPEMNMWQWRLFSSSGDVSETCDDHSLQMVSRSVRSPFYITTFFLKTLSNAPIQCLLIYLNVKL